MNKKAVLCIIDGFGVNIDCINGDATKKAKTPSLDYFYKKYPNTLLSAHGCSVGLEKNSMGNSEVGHLTIGAGQVIPQKIEEINIAIQNKSFFQKLEHNLNSLIKDGYREITDSTQSNTSDFESYNKDIEELKNNDKERLEIYNIHVVGLLSDGGIHSHKDHILAVIGSLTVQYRLFIHVITDGRDTHPKICLKYLKELISFCRDMKNVFIATICGRFYAMDRDKNYERTEIAIEAILGNKSFFDHTDVEYHIDQGIIYNKRTICTENEQSSGINLANIGKTKGKFKRTNEKTASLAPHLGTYSTPCLTSKIIPNNTISSTPNSHICSTPSYTVNTMSNIFDGQQNSPSDQDNSPISQNKNAAPKNLYRNSELNSRHFEVLKELILEFKLTDNPNQKVDCISKIVHHMYKYGYNDENIPPISFNPDYNNFKNVFIFCNFRQDRMRQITSQLSSKFKCLTMTKYGDFKNTRVLFDQIFLKNTLAEIISKNGLTQTHIAETEKYAHVTYFLNGYREEPFVGENRILIDSRKLESHDKNPAMKTPEICKAVCNEILKNIDFIVFNIAAPDMVGHTGNFDATVTAIEIMDRNLEIVYERCKENGYALFITADHGNAEVMIDTDGGQSKKHTINQVPFIICDSEVILKQNLKKYSLANVAPTILKYIGIDSSENQHSESLI